MIRIEKGCDFQRNTNFSYSSQPLAGRRDSIADHWYTGNFDAIFQDVWEGCTALLETLKKEL